MSTLSLVILGLLTAVPPASCQQGSIELGPQGCCGEEGWAGRRQTRCRWVGGGAVLAFVTTLYTCSWREEHHRTWRNHHHGQKPQSQASVCDLFSTSEKCAWETSGLGLGRGVETQAPGAEIAPEAAGS